MNTLGERLRSVMESLHLSQVEIAKSIGVVQGQISRWLQNSNTMSQPTAMAFQMALSVNWEWLLTGKGSQFIDNNQNLSVEEKKLLAIFKTIPIEDRDWVIRKVRKIVRIINFENA